MMYIKADLAHRFLHMRNDFFAFFPQDLTLINVYHPYLQNYIKYKHKSKRITRLL